MPKILAMVLAGGRVGELDVLTFYRPKSTVPFGGLYRIIDFPLSNLMHSGIERVGILSQYRSSSLVEHIGTGFSWDMAGRQRGISILPPFHGLHAADWYKGTADAVYQNLDFVQAHRPDLVIVLSGDHIYRMDYRELVRFHMDMDADVTVAFVKVGSLGSSRFGFGRMAEDDPRGGRLVEYVEKPVRPISDWASLTIYLFRQEVLAKVLEENASSDSHEFGRDVLPTMIGAYRVYGYKFEGFWGYSRTLEEYWEANMALLGQLPRIPLELWQVRTNLDHEAIRDRGPAFVGPDAVLDDVRLYNGVRVEGVVKRSILFPGAHVGEGAEVRDSVLFFDTQVGPGTRMERTISDVGASVGRQARIGRCGEALTVIGTQTQIPRGVELGAGCMVHPELGAEAFVQKVYGDGSLIR